MDWDKLKPKALQDELTRNQGHLLVIGLDIQLNERSHPKGYKLTTHEKERIGQCITNIIEIVGEINRRNFAQERAGKRPGIDFNPEVAEIASLSEYHPRIRKAFFRKLGEFKGSKFHKDWVTHERRRIKQVALKPLPKIIRPPRRL